MSEKVNFLDDIAMETFEKIGGWFQMVASVLFVLFALFNMVRTLVQNLERFYFLCFSAMLVLAWKMVKISAVELKEITKGGKK